MKKYQIIYADPPWPYRKFRDWEVMGGGVASHYPTLSIEQIEGMPISRISDSDCILFLWATCPFLPSAIKVMKAWGFEYKTVGFCWIKLNPKNGKPYFGMGHYTRGNCELCLIGVKGKSLRVSNKVSSVVMSPKRKHSQKPDEVRNLIVELCGDRPRIELFAREKADGWEAWGNEVKCDIEIKVPIEREVADQQP